MPFCEDCAKFWSPNSMPVTGKCPTCGLQIADPQELADDSDYKAPWHFKVMVVLAVLYVGFRVVQMIGWLV
jgi:hypothetical protein